MKVDDTDYKTLRKIQLLEEKSPLLSEIDWNFYSDLHVDLENLEKITEEEIQTIKRIIENIYEQREKKIAQAALVKARGGNPDVIHMLDIEKQLFDSVLEILTQSRKNSLYDDNEV